MINNYEKITNIQLHISDECSEENKEIIKYYWELDGAEMVNKPMFVKNKFNVTQTELTRIINTDSSITFYLYCENCESYEKQIVRSYSTFKQILGSYKNRHSGVFKCDSCKDLIKEQLRIDEQNIKKENIEKCKIAIQNKNWRNLSYFERELLVYCIGKDFYQVSRHYGKILGKPGYFKLIKALENIEMQDFLILERNPYNYRWIENFECFKELQEHHSEILPKEEIADRDIDYDKVSNTIKLKLTIDKNHIHPDSPKFSGLVKFNEPIILKPNVEYIFGHWQRANDNLFLTLTPLENLEKLPIQRRISETPISLQKGITDFLNNLGSSLDFLDNE